MIDRLRTAFDQQSASCAGLGSPFMARLMRLMGARLDRSTAVGARCHDWPGELGPAGQSVPLRLAGALHALVLDGSVAALRAVYPPRTSTDAALWSAVMGALEQHEARIMLALDQAPQTNELRRAAAVTAGLWWALGEVGDRPLVLSELGASAGLNLGCDAFGLVVDGTLHGPDAPVITLAPEWQGQGRPVPRAVRIKARAGVDLAPVDTSLPEDRLRLLSYLWPDQPERMARTKAALTLELPCPEAGDAAPWLATRLQTRHEGALHVVFSTVAAQYFPRDTLLSIAASLQAAGARATADAPLLHLALEADGAEPGAALVATLWRGAGPRQVQLGRAGFHVDWINWAPQEPVGPVFPLAG